MSSSPGDDREFSDSDRAWFAALSGRQTSDLQSQPSREGLALRVALEQRRREIDSDPELLAATSDEAIAAMREKLLQRARAEGLFEPAPSTGAALGPAVSNVVEFPWWRRRRPLLAMAASLLLGTLVLRQVLDHADYGDPPVMSGVGSVLQVRAPQPKKAAEELAARLKDAGLRSGLYQRSRTYVVDVQLMASELPAAEPSFKALGLEPKTGFNRVEFSAP